MLVLTRKLQQQIKIGPEITVTILRVKGNTVRVGVQAPRDVRVIRGELPKNGDQAAVVDEVHGEHDEGAVTVVTAEIQQPTESPAEESPRPVARALPLPVPAAACLPLRRIRNRHGAGPLKQIVASCGVLAK
jgi:carbon storage regulator CsrA